MTTINLLPESYRKPKESSLLLFVRSPLAFLIGALLAGLVGFLLLGSRLRRDTLNRLQVHIQQVEGSRAAVEQLAASVQKLREQKATLEQVIKSRSRWARHLNRLSDSTPQGIWFTDLLLDSDKGLVIQGSAIGKGGEEMVQIGHLAQELMADPGFSATVKDIRIQSIESVQEREVEVIKFTLTGSFAPAAGGAAP